MPQFLKLFSALLFVVCFVVASEAKADPLVITGGAFSQPSLDGHNFDITGQGFRASGWGYFGRTPCVPCVPGQVLDLRSFYAGGDDLKFGPATYNGTDYPQVWYSGSFTFLTESFVIPLNSLPGVVTITLPFTFSGHLTGYLQNPFIGNPGPAVFSLDLTGQGLAILELGYFPNLPNGPLYSFRRLTYSFQAAPVPEPGTLMLLGSGLTGLVAAVRRRRKRLQVGQGTPE